MSRSDSDLQPAGWSVEDDARSIVLALEALRMALAGEARSQSRRGTRSRALADQLGKAAHDIHTLDSTSPAGEGMATVRSGVILAQQALLELEPRAAGNGWSHLLHRLALAPKRVTARITKRPSVDHVAAAREVLAKLDRMLARSGPVPPRAQPHAMPAFSVSQPVEAANSLPDEALVEPAQRTGPSVLPLL